MRFQPKTEAQLTQEEKDRQEAVLLPKGDYDFEIGTGEKDATDEISKKKPDGSGGNEMIHLKLRVYTGRGDGWKFVDDYLLESMGWKLRHAAEACGLTPLYESGAIMADDFKGKCGKVTLDIQKGKLKDDGSGEKYPDRNSVKDYVVDKTVRPNTATQAFMNSQKLDDEIPF